jgi:hypothetical protein
MVIGLSMKCEDFAEHPLEPALQRYKKESVGIEIIGLVICVCLHMKTASDCTGIKTQSNPLCNISQNVGHDFCEKFFCHPSPC